ncbi:MAG: hypothetical protein ACSLFD_00955 [Solirubrobacterales bacterium]
MVLETEGALPPARRKRRRPKQSGKADAATHVSVTTATLIRAHDPLGTESEAAEWSARLNEDEFTQALLDEALDAVERVLAAEAAASGRPFAQSPALEQIVNCRIGYGDGDRLAGGRFIDAFDIDARGGTASSPRRERLGRTMPIARIAAILGGRDEAQACEFLVPRVRADFDAGRTYAAVLGIEPAARATLVEMDDALDVPDHEADLDELERMLPGLTVLTDRALEEGRSWDGAREAVEAPLRLAERVIRRRRVLEQ